MPQRMKAFIKTDTGENTSKVVGKAHPTSPPENKTKDGCTLFGSTIQRLQERRPLWSPLESSWRMVEHCLIITSRKMGTNRKKQITLKLSKSPGIQGGCTKSTCEPNVTATKDPSLTPLTQNDERVKKKGRTTNK